MRRNRLNEKNNNIDRMVDQMISDYIADLIRHTDTQTKYLLAFLISPEDAVNAEDERILDYIIEREFDTLRYDIYETMSEKEIGAFITRNAEQRYKFGSEGYREWVNKLADRNLAAKKKLS